MRYNILVLKLSVGSTVVLNASETREICGKI